MAYGILIVALLASTLAFPLKEKVEEDTDYDYDDDYYDDPETISDSKELQKAEDTDRKKTKDLQEIEDTQEADDTEEEEDIEKAEDTVSVSEINVKKTKTVNDKVPKLLKHERDREEVTTEKQTAQYEVTELVIDVPDDTSRRVPVITNFTLTKPLNLAGVPNKTVNNVGANVKDEGDEVINSFIMHGENKNKNNNRDRDVKGSHNKFNVKDDKNDFFTNFDITDKFDEEFLKEFGSNDDDFHDFELKEGNKGEADKGFKDQLHEIKKSILNEFQNVLNKHIDDIHARFPTSLFTKLHKKSSHLDKNLHDKKHKHKVHESDEFSHEYEDDC